MISRFISELSDSIREHYPDHSNWICRGANEGRLVVSKPHWPAEQTIEIPVSGGASDLWGVGQQVWGQHENGHPQLPFARSPSAGAAAFGKGKAAAITLYGDGQWVTPEADFLNSYGLTLATPQLVLTGGTLTSLATFDRFAAGSTLPGRWYEFITNSDQLGLVAFTCPTPGGGTTTVLACYSTLWDNALYVGGNSGAVREYAIQGSSTGLHDYNFNFSSTPGDRYELRGNKGLVTAVDRRQGHLFIDVATDPNGVYVVAVDSGIYALDRSTGNIVKTEWLSDPLRIQHSGSIAVWGKYLIECGWSGYDHSDAVMEEFSAAIGYRDPGEVYLIADMWGALPVTLVPLPDDTRRATLRFYVRNPDLTYTVNAVSLKSLVPGYTTRRVIGCGIHNYLASELMDSGGVGLSDYICYGADYNIKSTRWPFLIQPSKKECWFWVSTQCDDQSYSYKPGRAFFQVLGLNLEAGTLEVKNQISTPLTPSLVYPYASWLSDKEAVFAAAATASRTSGAAIQSSSYYTDTRVVAHANLDLPYVGGGVDPGTGDVSLITPYQVIERGHFYDGVSSTYQISETEYFIPHPLPGRTKYFNDYTKANDAICQTSFCAPSGCFDLEGNHYQIVSEPIQIVTDISESGTGGAGTVYLEVDQTVYWYFGQKGVTKPYWTYYSFYPDGIHPDMYVYSGGDPFTPEKATAELAPGDDWQEFIVSASPSVTIYELYPHFDTFGGWTYDELINPTEFALTPETGVPLERYYGTHTAASLTTEQAHKTYLLVTPPGSVGSVGTTKKDITEYVSWTGAEYGVPRFDNYPVFASCWQWVPVDKWLVTLRDMTYGAVGSMADTQNTEPYLEIYDRESLARLQKIALHPASDTGYTLHCVYELAPRMHVGLTATGDLCVEIWTEWTTDSDDNESNRLELMRHLTTQIKFKTSVAKVEHLWQGQKEAGYPLPTEASNLVRNGAKTYWIESSNSVVEYTNP